MNVFRESPYSTQNPVDDFRALSWLPPTASFFRRRWKSGALGLAVCLGLGVGYMTVTPSTYTAETDLMIDIRRADLLAQQQNSPDAAVLNAVLESQVEILRSEGMARQVVARMNLTHDPYFNTPDGFNPIKIINNAISAFLHPGTPVVEEDRTQSVAESLRKMSAIRRVGLTYVINITVKSSDATVAAKLANGIVAAYIASQMIAKENTTKEANVWLRDRLSELKDQATLADSAVERYKSDKGIVATDKGLMNEQLLSELNTQVSTARAKSAETKSKLDRITAIMKGDVLDATVAEGLQNTVITGLRLKYLDDVQLESAWVTKYGPEHNAVIKIRAEMQTIQRAIRQELGRIAESMQSDYAVAHADELSAEARMRELLKLTATTNGDRVALRSLQSSAETYRSVYENMLRRYTQAVQDQSFPVSDARVITTASPPPRRTWPQGKVVLGAASLAGLLFGFGAAFLRETMDNGIRSESQLRIATGLNCIGRVPSVRQKRLFRSRAGTSDVASRVISTRPDMLRHVLLHQNSKFSEAIRAITARITRGHRASPTNMIGVVASHTGEGTTTIVTNVAQSLAKAGHRTLLVDWSGSLSTDLTPHAKAGFLDLLGGSTTLSNITWTDPDTGLHFLPKGIKAPSHLTSILINDPRAQDVRAELLRHYEFVLFDIPALTPVNDMHAATLLLDSFLLVVSWGRADVESTMGSMTGSELDDRRFLGAVFNNVDLRSHHARGALPVSPAMALNND